MLQERHVYKAPMFPLWAIIAGIGIVLAIATYPFYGAAYVTSLLGKFLCFFDFRLKHRFNLGLHGDFKFRAKRLFWYWRLFYRTIIKN